MGLDVALFEGSVPRDLLCSSCGRVLVQPEMSTCQHVFCSSRLRKNVAMACPACGTWLQLTSYPPPSKLCMRLLDLRIRCDHKCGQTISLGSLPQHVESACPNAPVSCPHAGSGCRKMIRRCEKEEHAKECDFRPVTCDACGHKTIFRDLFTHQSKRRCVELRLKHHLIQAVKQTRKEIRRHQKHLDRQQLRIELHNRRTELDHHKKRNTARQEYLRQQHYNIMAENSADSSSSTGSVIQDRLGSKGNPTWFVLPPSRADAPPSRGGAPPSRGRVAPPSRGGISPFVTAAPPSRGGAPPSRGGAPPSRGGERSSRDHNPISNSGNVPPSSRTSLSREKSNPGLFITGGNFEERTAPGTSQTQRDLIMSERCVCRNCRKAFTESSNKANSCRWHAGPIIELFGGTCYSCGKLDYQSGCMMGFHEM